MVLIIDPQNAGISGNMVVGALIDLGAHINETQELMEHSSSFYGGANINISKVNSSGIKATLVEVKSEINYSISYKKFQNKLNELQHDLLEPEMLEFARRVFHTLAWSEAKVHGISLNKIHFHEVGAADAVADVIGASFAYHQLGLNQEKIYALPVALGGGTIRASHGRMPVPAPATLNILKGALTFGGPVEKELTTPTGAAILMTMKDEFKPFQPMLISSKVGYGSGSMDLGFPNILRIIKGQNALKEDKISLLETNVDHLSGEVLGHIFEILMEEGALDVTLIPTIMKKNRPGQLLRVICKSKDAENVTRTLFKETGTLGVRNFPLVHRSILKRKIITLEVNIKGLQKLKFKLGMLGSRIITSRVEYEDARRVSQQTGIPLKDIIKMADQALKNYLKNQDRS